MKLLVPILCLCIVSLVTVIQAPATPELVMGPPAPAFIEPDISHGSPARVNILSAAAIALAEAAQDPSRMKHLLHAQNEYLACLSDIDPTVLGPQTCVTVRSACLDSCAYYIEECQEACNGNQWCLDGCDVGRLLCDLCCACEFDCCQGFCPAPCMPGPHMGCHDWFIF